MTTELEQQESVHYRVVSDSDILTLAPMFEKLGWPVPDPNMAKVVVCEAGEGDRAIILGFCVVQFVVHTEPMWVHPSTRGTGVAEGIVENVIHYVENDCKIKNYVAIVKPGSFAARLCEQNGMVPYPGQVMVRMIKEN